MKKVLVPIAPGFEEIETITVVNILRRAGARVVMAGTVGGVLEGSRGIKIRKINTAPQISWINILKNLSNEKTFRDRGSEFVVVYNFF